MISPDTFFLLDLEQKIDLLFREGTFVVSIRYYKYKVNLYMLENFYAEVFYNHKLDKIEKIEPLKRKTKRIKFYADQISLPADLLEKP